MIPVSVRTNAVDPVRLCSLADRVQNWFQFTSQARLGLRGKRHGQPHLVPLTLNDVPTNTLFSASRDAGVAVSAWQSEGISRYGDMEVESYLLLCSLLGLMQWRALDLNPHFLEEDFIHSSPSNCLYSTCPSKQEYALLLENPVVCLSCQYFYGCLGVEPELAAVQSILKHIRTRSDASRLSRN